MHYIDLIVWCDGGDASDSGGCGVAWSDGPCGCGNAWGDAWLVALLIGTVVEKPLWSTLLFLKMMIHLEIIMIHKI